MSGEMVPIIIVPAIFFSIVAMVKIVSDNMVRRKIIEKGVIDEKVKYLYLKAPSNVPASLKWGMVFIAFGSAILVGQLVPYSFQDEAIISGMFILGGLALIAYYFIAGKMAKSSDGDL